LILAAPIDPKPTSSPIYVREFLDANRKIDSRVPSPFHSFTQMNPSGILFYQGMATGSIVSVLPLVTSWWRNNTTVALVRNSVIAFLLIYAFVITVPTNADRSFSLKMLQRLAHAPSGLSREGINKYYAIDFLESGGLDQRLVEQQATGTVVEHDGRYTLTSRGEVVNV
jgi:hypothetical protein